MLNELNALNNDEQTKSNIENHQKEMMDMIENISKITEKEQEKGDKPGVQQLFNNGIISDIAKELTNELDLDKLDLGNPQNMNEAFSNIMGGAGGNNFFDLISKVKEVNPCVLILVKSPYNNLTLIFLKNLGWAL